jgi:hypothetical protein
VTASIITVYDREGNILADLEAAVEREWLLNQYGKATFTLAKTDPKCIEDFLQFGNRILIHGNGDDEAGAFLPAWVGVIDPPRTWGDHDVTVTAYSAEYLFSWRRGPGEKQIKKTGSFGDVFREIITYANGPEDLFIREGDISDAGAEAERTLELHNMYDAVVNLAKDSGMEWGLEHTFDGGRLRLLAHWWIKRGVFTSFAFEEGQNIKLSRSPMEEQGTIVNDVLAYSSSMVGWNPAKTAQRVDETSRYRYGLRQSALSVSTNNGDVPTVKAAAEAELKKKRQPRRTFDVTVMGAATLAQLGLGNTYILRQISSGFPNPDRAGIDTIVRVIGMLWNDAAQEMRLNVEEEIPE